MGGGSTADQDAAAEMDLLGDEAGGIAGALFVFGFVPGAAFFTGVAIGLKGMAWYTLHEAHSR
jgi:hypothetical protein